MSSLPIISAIIPALNEEETIENVIKNLFLNGIFYVLVVDNGSTDKTAHLASQAGAIVIPESQRGYGKACLTGIAHLPKETEWVLFCDADGSDDLSELHSLFQHLNQYDFIIGNRRATPEGRNNLTPVQNFGNWLSGFLMKIGWGKGFSDLGPLRLIKKSTLHSLEMEDENFGWTVEMQAKALSSELSCVETPVNYLPRQGGTSKISGNFLASFQAGKIILSTIGKLWMSKPSTQKPISLLSILLLLIGAAIMGLKGDPASTAYSFFTGALIMSIGYGLSFFKKDWAVLLLFPLAIVLRILLLPMPPGDDVWRYLWEGIIQNSGHNPYNTAPESETLLSLRTEWWKNINHKDVTAIYPPLTQLIFRLITALSTSVLAMKLLFIIADISIGVLLFRTFKEKAAWYLLNPLTLYCTAGGAHYEPLFLLPLVSAWLLFKDKPRTNKNLFLTGLLLGISFSIKIVALFTVGFIGFSLLKNFTQHIRKHISCFLFFITGFIIIPTSSYLLLLSLSGPVEQLFPSAFTATARSAELIPWILENFNTLDSRILPNKAFLPLLFAVLFLILITARSFSGFQSRCFLALLALSPMIHGWYFTWLLPFALARHARTIILLTLTGFLYFLLPYRQSIGEGWILHWYERLLLWSPLLLLIPAGFKFIKELVLLSHFQWLITDKLRGRN